MHNKTVARRILAAACAFCALGFIPGTLATAHASAASKALSAEIKAAPKYSGKIDKIDTVKGTITIHQKKGAPDLTFTVTSTTRIKIDKVKSALGDIKTGERATIHSSDKVTALEINVHTKAAAPAGATPAPTPA